MGFEIGYEKDRPQTGQVMFDRKIILPSSQLVFINYFNEATTTLFLSYEYGDKMFPVEISPGELAIRVRSDSWLVPVQNFEIQPDQDRICDWFRGLDCISNP